MEKKFGFGLMHMPVKGDNEKKVDFEQVCLMADEFLADGFTYFDTAYMYHGGMSEEFLRRAVVERHPGDSFTVADELPLMPAFITSADMLRRITEEQLKNAAWTTSIITSSTTSARIITPPQRSSAPSNICRRSKRKASQNR